MKRIFFVLFIALAVSANAQQALTGQGSQTINQYWSRTGNIGNGSTPVNSNIFGTAAGWNSPIYTETFGIIRTRLNGNLIENVNGVNQTLDGFFGIGVGGFFANNAPISMLHLEGPNNTMPPQNGFGWRSWMNTGSFMRENSDAMYVGMQTQEGTILNRSDAIINWSDDFQDQWGGADRLKIVMTTPGAGNGNNTSRIDGSSKFGYEFMQFIPSNNQVNSSNLPTGYVGIGPVFTSIQTDRPQSRLHINSEDNLETWLQISSQTGTGQLQTDGFRMGILTDGTACLRQQENKPMILSTDWNNTSGGANTGERLRVTAVGELNVPNPNNVFLPNTTRVAISHMGNNPITAPRSLLHLGANTGALSPQGSADGWRPWMDVGMFVSDGSDNVYLGMKNQGTDRGDAVLSWGDNQPAQSPDGADNLLFLFTATNTALIPSTGQAATVNGVEGMRMTPTATGIFTGIGGNPGTNNYFNNSTNPTQTLEINSAIASTSGLRFTKLNSTSPQTPNVGTGVLSLNVNGDVVYVPMNSANAVSAENGCSVNTDNKVVLGNDYGSGLARFSSSREVPMEKFNLLFSEKGRIGIGNYFTAGTNIPLAKLDIRADYEINPLALHVRSDIGIISGNYTMSEFNNFSTNGGTSTAVSIHNNGNADKRGIGLNILIDNTTTWALGENVGLICDAKNALRYNTGGMFSASGEVEKNIGISAGAHLADRENTGGSFRAGNPQPTVGGYNGITNIGVYADSWGGESSYGIYAKAEGGSNYNYGIYATAVGTGSSTDYAAYFDGDIYRTGGCGPSDFMLKENIANLSNSTSIINQLMPKSFTFKTAEFPQMKLSEGNQFGLIAQDVELILPELVKNVTHPAVLDSLGNVVTAAVTFKTLKYESFIPILIQGVKEVSAKNDSTFAVLNTRIDSLQNVISNFNNRMNQFEDQLNDCCKNNGHNGHNNHKSSSENGNSLNLTEVVLENSTTILLEQNVPNPFAESTIINYFIPENIKFAQIIFSDNFGRIIKTVDIETSGAGTVKAYASNLSQGTYTYSLVVDGKVVETKKMVCVK